MEIGRQIARPCLTQVVPCVLPQETFAIEMFIERDTEHEQWPIRGAASVAKVIAAAGWPLGAGFECSSSFSILRIREGLCRSRGK
jgi:hypothetical protein